MTAISSPMLYVIPSIRSRSLRGTTPSRFMPTSTMMPWLSIARTVPVSRSPRSGCSKEKDSSSNVTKSISGLNSERESVIDNCDSPPKQIYSTRADGQNKTAPVSLYDHQDAVHSLTYAKEMLPLHWPV